MEISVNIVRHLLKKVEVAGHGDLLLSAPNYLGIMGLAPDSMLDADSFFRIIHHVNDGYPEGQLAYDVEYKHFTSGQISMLGALGQLVQVSPTLAGISEAFYKYYGTYNKLFAPVIERRGSYMASQIQAEEPSLWRNRAFQVTVEMFLYGTLKIAREWFADPALSPVGLAMPYHLPAFEKSLMESTFGLSIAVGTECTMLFTSDLYKRPLPYANPELWDHLKQYLDNSQSAKAEDEIFKKTKAFIIEQLPKSSSLVHAASAVFLSERSLQRRLRDQNTTFQVLLDDARKQKAQQQLKSSTLSLKEIAFNCGFQDANSFFRAFKKWTGRTPEQWRMNL